MTLLPNYSIMVNMKRFSIVFLMVMFLANTVVVSAWAKPCMMNDTEMTEMSQKFDMGDMPPCHEENKSEKQDSQQSNTNHCEGVCLCLHVSITQTPVLSDFVTVPDIALGAETYNPHNESVPSQDYSPSNPPPIFIS